MDIFLILPIHLFSNIKTLKGCRVYVIEDPRFFADFKVHKLKLAYHRATMKSYYDMLKRKGFKVRYIDYDKVSQFYDSIGSNHKLSIYMYDPNDTEVNGRMKRLFGGKLCVVPTLNFLVTESDMRDNRHKFYKNGKYSHSSFYKWQRTRYGVLMDRGQPKGGKWSFDEENRHKLPKDYKVTKVKKVNNKYVREAIKYVEKRFNVNYGSLDHFVYPIDNKGARAWVKMFCKNKFKYFGKYEDAVHSKDPFVYHSLLSVMMNVGLVTDSEVLKIVAKYERKIDIASYEGFIRQIMGWRNYMYMVYVLEGDKIRKSNNLNHVKRLDFDMMWRGKTGIAPIDSIIGNIVKYGYVHHIERLMFLGNYMLLSNILPSDVYKIFMEWTVDAYDWVMVGNVYCMSQYANDCCTTKPYFVSSSYMLRMSNYVGGPWTKVIDDMYYEFIRNNEDMLSKNYGAARQVFNWRRFVKNDLSDESD